MALGKKVQSIQKLGGGTLYVKEVGLDGGLPPYPAWVASKTYAVGDRFINASIAYRVNSAYTAGTTFGATDTNNCSVVSTYRDIGYLQESTFKDGEGNPDVQRDEAGNIVNVIEGDIEVSYEALLMQTDKDTIDFIRELRGKTIALKYAMGKNGTLTQTLYMGICDCQRNIEVKTGTKRIPFRALAYANNTGSALTVDTSKTQAVGDYYLLDEA